jgi:acetyl esterase/lipase
MLGRHLEPLAGLSAIALWGRDYVPAALRSAAVPAFRGELDEDADTTVDAVVGIYGRYDWRDRSIDRYARELPGLPGAGRGAAQSVSSSGGLRRRVADGTSHEDAPPFFLIHGVQDTIIPIDEARQFRAAFRAVSRNPVGYSELPRAGDAFDLVDTCHARPCAEPITMFLTTSETATSKPAP